MAERFWRLSPERVYHAVRRRLFGDPWKEAMRPRWVTVRAGIMEGVRLFIAPGALDIFQEMEAGTYDAGFTRELAGWPGIRGAVCWDIGAHVGYHALLMAKLAGPEGRVVAFEPNAANVERFRMHLEANPDLASRIRLETMAVGASAGEATFVTSTSVESGFSSGSHLEASTTPRTEADYRSFARVTVPVRSIDGLIASGLPRPSVVKVDVEGAETQVLEGAASLLADRNGLWLIEVHHILLMLTIAGDFVRRGAEVAPLEDSHGSASRCFVRVRYPAASSLP